METAGSRPFPPHLVKEAACHDPRRLLSVRHLRFVRRGSPLGSCDADRVVRPLLALRIAYARGEQKGVRCRKMQPENDARAKPTRAPSPLPTPDRRPVHVGRLFPCGRLTRESHVDLRQPTGRVLRHANVPLRVARFETAPALASSPPRPCHRARETPSFPGVLRMPTERATFSPRSARFRVVEARSRTTRDDFMIRDVGRGLRDEGPTCPLHVNGVEAS